MLLADLIFYIALSFLFGVFLAGLNISLFYAAILSVAFLGVVYILKKSGLKYLIILAVVIFAGIFYFHFRLNLTEEKERQILAAADFSGVVANEPQLGEKVQQFTLDLKPPQSGEIQVVASLFPVFHYGDLLEISGKPEPAARIGALPAISFPEIKLIGEHRGLWLKEKLLNFKNGLEGQFKNFLLPQEAALLGGLTFGTRADFSKEFKNQMSASGTTHLVALSGYNIAILVLAVAWVFGYFFSRRLTFFLTTAVIFLFVMMVGAEASVVRAAIMGFLLLAAKEFGRLPDMRNAVTLTAFAMVVLDPAILPFNVGFILSFASLLGIVYLSPAIKKFFKIRENSGENFLGWRENAVMTLSAQLAVLPIIIQTFGQFSLTAVLANILILEFVPLTMFLGFLLAALGSLFYAAGFLVAKLADILLVYEIGVIRFFAALRLPLAVNFRWPIFVIYYLCLVAFIVCFSHSKENEKT